MLCTHHFCSQPLNNKLSCLQSSHYSHPHYPSWKWSCLPLNLLHLFWVCKFTGYPWRITPHAWVWRVNISDSPSVTTICTGLIIFLLLYSLPLPAFTFGHFPYMSFMDCSPCSPIYDTPLPCHYCTTYVHIRRPLMCTVASPLLHTCLMYYCTIVHVSLPFSMCITTPLVRAIVV